MPEQPDRNQKRPSTPPSCSRSKQSQFSDPYKLAPLYRMSCFGLEGSPHRLKLVNARGQSVKIGMSVIQVNTLRCLFFASPNQAIHIITTRRSSPVITLANQRTNTNRGSPSQILPLQPTPNSELRSDSHKRNRQGSQPPGQSHLFAAASQRRKPPHNFTSRT